MTYTVWYRLPGFFRRRHKISGVSGDGIVQESGYPTRFFLLDDKRRLEVPSAGTVFEFSAERFALIHERMEQQAGQAIPIRK